MTKEFCPCGSKKAEQYCCGMYLSGKKSPETAEKLMRSRYTAFYHGNVDYLITTLYLQPQGLNHDAEVASLRAELTQSINHTEWLGLTVISTQQGKKNDTSGIVEFEAIYQADEIRQLHERSRFIKTQDRWFYVDGDILPGTIPKPKQLCWCGSGKKYKQCHGV